MESVTVEMWGDYQLCELDIEFKSECGYGDVVAAVTAREGSAEGVVIEEDNARVIHQLVKLGDDGRETEVIRARSTWRRKGAMTAEEKEMAVVIAAACWQRRLGLCTMRFTLPVCSTGLRTEGWCRRGEASLARRWRGCGAGVGPGAAPRFIRPTWTQRCSRPS